MNESVELRRERQNGSNPRQTSTDGPQIVSATSRIVDISFNIAHSNSLISVNITRGASLGAERRILKEPQYARRLPLLIIFRFECDVGAQHAINPSIIGRSKTPIYKRTSYKGGSIGTARTSRSPQLLAGDPREVRITSVPRSGRVDNAFGIFAAPLQLRDNRRVQSSTPD